MKYEMSAWNFPDCKLVHGAVSANLFTANVGVGVSFVLEPWLEDQTLAVFDAVAKKPLKMVQWSLL